MPTRVSYSPTWDGESWTPGVCFAERFRSLATHRPRARVCEIGAGANPTLPLSFVREHKLDYVITDVSADELRKAPPEYTKVVADITDHRAQLGGPFDVVVSRTVVEHVDDPERLHRNVYELLAPGGYALHLFPTLFSLPFVVNRVLPPAVTASVLPRLRQGREGEGKHGKFPPHYRWCRGPVPRQIERFSGVGFDVEEYHAFFGHHYYERWPRLQRLQDRLAHVLARHPLPAITSFSVVVLRRATDPGRCAATDGTMPLP